MSSGPAQAWYVDTLHAVEGPDADLKPGLAAGGVAGALALALGMLIGGFLPLVPLVAHGHALVVPVWAAAGAATVLFVTVLVLMREPPNSKSPALPTRRPTRFGDVVRDVPMTIAGGFRLALTDRGLGRLLLAGLAGMLSSLGLLPLAAVAGTGPAWSLTAAIVLVSALLYVRLPAAKGGVAGPPVERNSVRGQNQAQSGLREG